MMIISHVYTTALVMKWHVQIKHFVLDEEQVYVT